MAVTIKFFASLRESLGRAEDHVEAQAGCTVADVWDQVSGGRQRPSNVLCAVNLEYVSPDHAVRDGDEVAFFPPVTGG